MADLQTPESALWRAVVAQAVIDASWRQTGKHEKSAGESRCERDLARTWLLGNSGDFREVCSLAGWDPDAVRESVERKDKAGWPPVEKMLVHV